MLSLQKPYIRVDCAGAASYGGNQMRSDKEIIRKCGCGEVAALDLILYLTDDSKTLPLVDYNRELEDLCRRYFPLIPPFGINGLLLAVGVNRLLLKHRLPYRAVWVVSGKKLRDRIETQLRRDLPVILSIGPNFPAFWEKHRLQLYTRTPDGRYYPAASVKAHYITVTGMDETWLRVASWGKEYYINWDEYCRYVQRHSNSVVSNMLFLKKHRGFV